MLSNFENRSIDVFVVVTDDKMEETSILLSVFTSTTEELYRGIFFLIYYDFAKVHVHCFFVSEIRRRG